MNAINKIDELGELLAQIADLTKRADEIKTELREIATAPAGTNVFEGAVFKATVVSQNRNAVDYKALIAELGCTDDQLVQFTSITASFAVRVTSR
jgi:hypothetical protein